jgi:phage baseplate assembly protein W
VAVGQLYGVSIRATDPFFGKLTDDQEILTQAIVLRLSTARGTFWTDREYGFPVTELVNEHLTAAELARIPGKVQAELEKDERISTVDIEATLESTPAGRRLRLVIRVAPRASGPFALTLAVSQVSVEVLTRGSA